MQDSSQVKYFDLHTTGVGYLNRVREVKPERGQPFLAVDVAALHGATDNLQKTRFDCRVSGKEAQTVVKAAMKHREAGRNVLVGFKIGDLYVETFTYKSGDRAGQTGVSLKARLLRIDWVKVDGRMVYKARSGDSGQPAEASADTEAEPGVVRLSKDDPDFEARKAELKKKGYRFDGHEKVWRPAASSAA